MRTEWAFVERRDKGSGDIFLGVGMVLVCRHALLGAIVPGFCLLGPHGLDGLMAWMWRRGIDISLCC